jgi:hypothetical protein
MLSSGEPSLGLGVGVGLTVCVGMEGAEREQ